MALQEVHRPDGIPEDRSGESRVDASEQDVRMGLVHEAIEEELSRSDSAPTQGAATQRRQSGKLFPGGLRPTVEPGVRLA